MEQPSQRQFEIAIYDYKGKDPLSTWYEYIVWAESCVGEIGLNCKLVEIVKRCLRTFRGDRKYYQDDRLIRIYVKYIDSQVNPLHIYKNLYRYGFGTTVADFYIAWSYYFDIMGDLTNTHKIFLLGFDNRAKPLGKLERAHKMFSLSIPGRLINRDAEFKRIFLSTMEEKRLSITFLKPIKNVFDKIPEHKMAISLNDICGGRSTATNVTYTLSGATTKDPSKLVAFTTTTQLKEDNKDVTGFTAKLSETVHLLENEIIDVDNFDTTQRVVDDPPIITYIDPWKIEVSNGVLNSVDFIGYLKHRPDCVLLKKEVLIEGEKTIRVVDKLITSIEHMTKDVYGSFFKGTDSDTGKHVLIKEARLFLYWEYYISMVISERLCPYISRFLLVKNAMISETTAILLFDCPNYKTLLDIRNEFHVSTRHNIDELLVIIIAIEMFTTIDLMHSTGIIHGNIKLEKFLLISKLSLGYDRPFLQLLGFGNSIDMQRFPEDTKFKIVKQEDHSFCSEMRDDLPWTYQPDFYSLAGTLHVLLFGEYMATQLCFGRVRIINNFQLNPFKPIWESLFDALLNVPDCKHFPNLKFFIAHLKGAVHDNEKHALDLISVFNKFLTFL